MRLDNLHSKLFLFESRWLRVAMVGSPNFTPNADESNRELAIEVRSTRETDSSAALINELSAYARDLMCDDLASFIHSRTSS